MRWAVVLTRNDRAKAEEIVQEFCLYVTNSKPDFTHAANLDGYLYTCLRHIFLSSMARASRDALRHVNSEDYDSFALAVSSTRQANEMLRCQNDLRRACAYSVWRKNSSKTASYFILHFFHGYERQEVADLARVTMATIYNKLKAARAEVGAYLQDAGKIKTVGHEEPPSPRAFWHVVPVSELFNELRETILAARLTECLPEDELRALYYEPSSTPIPCELLAHIVSCESCLAILDHLGRRPTLKEREPLDVFGFSPREGGERPDVSADKSFEETMRVVQSKWQRVRDHRPRSLSITLNGEVIAAHDIQVGHNRLSARIEMADRARFVEVFSEQDIRLALLSLEARTPEIPTTHHLRVELSDARWLDLNLRMDGLGLEAEVLYSDPVISHATEPEETLALCPVPKQSITSSLREAARRCLSLTFAPVVAWALVLLMVAGSGFWFYLNRPSTPLGAEMVLSKASQVQTAALRGQTEHEVVRIEEWSPEGDMASAGAIDLWKDGDGSRYIRTLYDKNHNLQAVEWLPKGRPATKLRTLRQVEGMVGQYWDQDLSADAFAGINSAEPQVQATANGYEIKKTGSSRKYPQLVSATLIVNNRYEAIGQRLMVQTATGVRQLRFVRESYETRPSHSVPDETFDGLIETGRRGRSEFRGHRSGEENDQKLAELEISVLYALRLLNSDTGVPIALRRTTSGRIQVVGMVANDNLRRQILTRLHGLANAYFLDLKITASAEASAPMRSATGSGLVESFEVSQTRFAADAPVRRYLGTKNLSGDALDQAVGKFSQEALLHAQKALQHAYALDRLGILISGDEFRSVGGPAQREWTAMVQEHATGVQTELRGLRQQLASVWPREVVPNHAQEDGINIGNPAQYGNAAHRLLEQVSALNGHVGELFTADGRLVEETNQEILLQAITNASGLSDSSSISEFAAKLSEAAAGKRAASSNE